ncbi:MAG: hypothetical protein RSE41_10220 [Clostridia bacterium]
MILNARSNQFQIHFPKTFFYPHVIEKWNPIIKSLKLPYDNIVDFMNSCIQSVSFPSISLPTMTQQESQYEINWRGGKELEALKDKNLNITFKLTESYISYWIIYDQIEYFLQYGDKMPWWPPMYLSFIDNAGFEMIRFQIKKIIPTALSELNLTYSQALTNFQTFNLSIKYNRFDVKYTKNNRIINE